jgi:hypothetical protein
LILSNFCGIIFFSKIQNGTQIQFGIFFFGTIFHELSQRSKTKSYFFAYGIVHRVRRYIRSNFFALKKIWRLLGGVAGISIYFFNFVDRETCVLVYLVFFNLPQTQNKKPCQTLQKCNRRFHHVHSTSKVSYV